MQDPAFKEAEIAGGIQAVIGFDAMPRHYAASRKSEPPAKISEKPPDKILDFITDFMSAARDEARQAETAGLGTADGGDKPATAWIPVWRQATKRS